MSNPQITIADGEGRTWSSILRAEALGVLLRDAERASAELPGDGPVTPADVAAVDLEGALSRRMQNDAGRGSDTLLFDALGLLRYIHDRCGLRGMGPLTLASIEQLLRRAEDMGIELPPAEG